MIVHRKATERGSANHGWLQSYHSFSFANYYDPNFMGFSVLRVLNEDHVAPKMGFPTHGHRDMEIISYVLDGAIKHRDSSGHEQVITSGEFQVMTAGTGVKHSEYNASADKNLNFIQIWIMPREQGLKPHYDSKKFDLSQNKVLVASADAREGSLKINQDIALYLLQWPRNSLSQLPLADGRQYYLHITRGSLVLNGQQLNAGDAVAVANEATIQIHSAEDTEVLFFDMP